MQAERVRHHGLIAGFCTLAAVCALYGLSYVCLRASHVFVHYREWDSAGVEYNRIDTGDHASPSSTGYARIAFAPLMILEERVRAMRPR